MGKTSRRVNLSLYRPCPVSRGRRCTTLLLRRWGESRPARTGRRAWHRPPAHPRFLPHAPSETRKWRSLRTPPSSQGRSHGAWLRGAETSTDKRRPALRHVTLPVTCLSAIRANQRPHHVYIPSAVMFSQRENLQGSRTLTSNPFFLLRCHALGRRAIHLWFGVMEHITSGLQENKMLLRNNGIFCLWSWLAPFIYTRDQQSLAAHHQGHQATASSQNHEVFKLNRKEKWERERTWHSCPETEANSWPVPQPERVKLLLLPHIPWYFQAKLLAAKGLIHPRHCSAHTPRGKCWNVVWCFQWEGATKSLNNATPCRLGTENTFLHLREVRQDWRVCLTRWCCSKGYIQGHRQIYNALSLWKSFKQLGLKKSYMFNIEKCFLHTDLKETAVCSHHLCAPW